MTFHQRILFSFKTLFSCLLCYMKCNFLFHTLKLPENLTQRDRNMKQLNIHHSLNDILLNNLLYAQSLQQTRWFCCCRSLKHGNSAHQQQTKLFKSLFHLTIPDGCSAITRSYVQCRFPFFKNLIQFQPQKGNFIKFLLKLTSCLNLFFMFRGPFVVLLEDFFLFFFF